MGNKLINASYRPYVCGDFDFGCFCVDVVVSIWRFGILIVSRSRFSSPTISSHLWNLLSLKCLGKKRPSSSMCWISWHFDSGTARRRKKGQHKKTWNACIQIPEKISWFICYVTIAHRRWVRLHCRREPFQREKDNGNVVLCGTAKISPVATQKTRNKLECRRRTKSSRTWVMIERKSLQHFRLFFNFFYSLLEIIYFPSPHHVIFEFLWLP